MKDGNLTRTRPCPAAGGPRSGRRGRQAQVGPTQPAALWAAANFGPARSGAGGPAW